MSRLRRGRASLIDSSKPVGEAPSPGRSLSRLFSWAFFGNVFYAACQWAMLVAVARLGTPEMVGQLTLGLAISAPVFIFANLKLRQVQATDVRGEYAFGDYLGLRLCTSGGAVAVVAAIVLLAGYSVETVLVVLLVAFAKALESLSDVIYGLMQRRERLDAIARAMAVKGLLALFGMTFGLLVADSLAAGILGMVAAFGLTALRDRWRLGVMLRDAGVSRDESRLAPRFRRSVLRRLARLTLPLGFVTMLGSLQTNIPHYVIQEQLGEAQLGVFAAMAYFMVAGSTVISAVSQAAISRMATFHQQGRRQAFVRLLSGMVGLGGLLGLAGVAVAVFAGEMVLEVVYGTAYADSADVLVWLMVAALVQYIHVFLGTAANAMRQYKFQPYVQALGAVTVLAVSWVVVPVYGITGAAWALLAGALVNGVSYTIASLWLFRLTARGEDG
jgi:O-antigen/teichoic acid export membrane protein